MPADFCCFGSGRHDGAVGGDQLREACRRRGDLPGPGDRAAQRDAVHAAGHHLRHVLFGDAADGRHREPDTRAGHLPQDAPVALFAEDRREVLLRGRIAERPEADVVGRTLRDACDVGERVGRAADNGLPAQYDARLVGRRVVLPEVCAVGVDRLGQPRVVVDDQQRVVAAVERDDLLSGGAACDTPVFLC